jgi:hypothetical protein
VEIVYLQPVPTRGITADLEGAPKSDAQDHSDALLMRRCTSAITFTRGVFWLSLLKSPLLLWQLKLWSAMVRFSAMISVLRSLLLTLGTLAYSRAALHLEVLALRHQLEVLQRTRPRRIRLAKTDRWLWVLLSRFWSGWRTAVAIVKPETVITWHRRASDSGGRGRVGAASGDRQCPLTSAR